MGTGPEASASVQSTREALRVTPRSVLVLLLGFVLLAVGAASWLLVRGERAAPAGDPPPGEAAGPNDAKRPAAARLAGAAVRQDDASLEELVSLLGYGGEGAGEAKAREEIARRAAAPEELVARLMALLDLDREALGKRGLTRHQILEALVAVGRPAAVPLAERLLAAKPGWYDGRYALFECLRQLGPDAAPAVPVLLGAWDRDAEFQRLLLPLLATVGPGAEAALPLLYEILAPPVDDELAADAGAAALVVSEGSPEAISAIRGVLLDEETLARPALLRTIGGTPAGAEPLVPLLAELLHDPERHTQTAAAYALGRIGIANRDVLLGLVSLLADGGPQGKRTSAAALSALGDEGTRVLIEVARESVDVDDRLAAFSGLLRTGADVGSHVDILLGILDEDVERDWKLRALGLLQQIDPAPPPALVLPHVARALADERLGRAALDVLARLPGEEARGAIRTHLAALTDAEEALVVIEGLTRHRIAEPDATERLLDLARTETDPKRLTRVFHGIGRANPPASAARGLPVVEPHLAAGDRGVRQAAWYALTALEGEEERVVAHLLSGLSASDLRISGIVAPALAARPGYAEKSVPALVTCVARWANASGFVEGQLVVALRQLAPHWAGTAKAFDEAVAAANERGRSVLEDLRRRYGL